MLEPNTRYIQIAFNRDAAQVRRILPKIPYDPRIIIEAGTPYISLVEDDFVPQQKESSAPSLEDIPF